MMLPCPMNLGLTSGAVDTSIAQDLIQMQSSRPSPEPGVPPMSCEAGKPHLAPPGKAPGEGQLQGGVTEPWGGTVQALTRQIWVQVLVTPSCETSDKPLLVPESPFSHLENGSITVSVSLGGFEEPTGQCVFHLEPRPGPHSPFGVGGQAPSPLLGLPPARA